MAAWRPGDDGSHSFARGGFSFSGSEIRALFCPLYTAGTGNLEGLPRRGKDVWAAPEISWRVMDLLCFRIVRGWGDDICATNYRICACLSWLMSALKEGTLITRRVARRVDSEGIRSVGLELCWRHESIQSLSWRMAREDLTVLDSLRELKPTSN